MLSFLLINIISIAYTIISLFFIGLIILWYFSLIFSVIYFKRALKAYLISDMQPLAFRVKYTGLPVGPNNNGPHKGKPFPNCVYLDKGLSDEEKNKRKLGLRNKSTKELRM